MKPQLVLHQQRWHDNDIALCYHRALWCVHAACILIVVFLSSVCRVIFFLIPQLICDTFYCPFLCAGKAGNDMAGAR